MWRGGVSRAAKGADCKSAGLAFVGSSPTSPTIFIFNDLGARLPVPGAFSFCTSLQHNPSDSTHFLEMPATPRNMKRDMENHWPQAETNISALSTSRRRWPKLIIPYRTLSRATVSRAIAFVASWSSSDMSPITFASIGSAMPPVSVYEVVCSAFGKLFPRKRG
jgi:hypothetical protein